ncbi:MAG: glycosyltransferase family 4 protein [Planctomycetota bacterium]
MALPGVLNKELGKGSSIIRLGIDANKFNQKPAEAKWPKKLRFVVVGRLIFQKGQDVAIKALKLVKDALSDHEVELRFLGDGDYQVELEELAGELGITENIKFLGSVPHTTVASEMHDADIQVVPSRTGKNGAIENVGTVSLEGLCTGLAVVASRSGGLPESVGDGGVLVDADDPQALADAIVDLIKKSTPAEMKERALKQAAKFTFEGMNKGYADVLEKAVNG